MSTSNQAPQHLYLSSDSSYIFKHSFEEMLTDFCSMACLFGALGFCFSRMDPKAG